jgi:CRP-like cAMP-binding protein
MSVIRPIDHLLRKLNGPSGVSGQDFERVAAVRLNLRYMKAGAEIIREGDRPSQCCLIVDGFAARSKSIAKGKRQIMSLHQRGDLPDLQGLHLDHADHDLIALTECRVGFISYNIMEELIFLSPAIGSFFWREALIDAAIFREWIVNIGRREGLPRVAHLFCEQAIRLKQQGLGDETGFPNFLKQTVIADATGQSGVHVNRIMQALRRRKLVETNDDRLDILSWEGLVAAADFRSDYLHLR